MVAHESTMELENLCGSNDVKNVKNITASNRLKLPVNIKILSWNAHSLKGNFTKLSEILDLACDIILIQETWLDKNQKILSISNSQGIPYKHKRVDRISKKKKTGGGTLTLFNDQIDLIKEVRINKDSGLYQAIINTPKGSKTLWIGNIYLNKG